MKFEHNIVGGIGIRVVNDVKSVYKTIMGWSPDDVNVGNYGMFDAASSYYIYKTYLPVI